MKKRLNGLEEVGISFKSNLKIISNPFTIKFQIKDIFGKDKT